MQATGRTEWGQGPAACCPPPGSLLARAAAIFAQAACQALGTTLGNTQNTGSGGPFFVYE